MLSGCSARSTLAIVLLAALSGACAAQERPASVPLDAGQRSISIDVIAGQRLVANNSAGFSEFVSPSVSIARPLSRRLEGSIILLPALVISQPTKQPPTADRETVWAAGLDLGLRLYPAPSEWRWVPFVDFLAGVVGARHRTPAGGTNFNFNLQSGVGLLLPVGERWHPFAVARWHHISNGNLGHRNPSWDQWSVGVGAKLDFRPGEPSAGPLPSR
jgi:hypothetical protein